MPDFVDHLRVHPIKHTGENGLAGLERNPHDNKGDQESHERVGLRVAPPHSDHAEQHGQAGQAIHARVLPSATKAAL